MSVEDKRATVSSVELAALASRKKSFVVLDNSALHIQTRELLRLVDETGKNILCDVAFVSNVGLLANHVAVSVKRIDDLSESDFMSYGQSSAHTKASQLKQWQVQGFDSAEQKEQWINLTRLMTDGARYGASLKARRVAEESKQQRELIKKIRDRNLGMEIDK